MEVLGCVIFFVLNFLPTSRTIWVDSLRKFLGGSLRQAPCLVILFLLQCGAKSQSITDSELERADRQPPAGVSCKELTQTKSESSPTIHQLGYLEQGTRDFLSLNFFFFPHL